MFKKMNSFLNFSLTNLIKKNRIFKPNHPEKTYNLIQPEEIRKIIRNFQVKKEKFSESSSFKLWTNSLQAIMIFEKYLNRNYHNYFKLEIFEEIKILLQNIEVSPEREQDKLFYERFSLLINKVFSQLKNKNFFDGNFTFTITGFHFLNSLLEIQFLVKNDHFIDNYFKLIENIAEEIVENNFIKNNNIFLKNIRILDELFNVIMKIFGGRYIESYNINYYYNSLKVTIDRVFTQMEKYFLYRLMIEKEFTMDNLELVLKISQIFYYYSVINLKCCDYINFYLIKHASVINSFKLLDILSYLSNFEGVINYQILNYFYEFILKQPQTLLINYPNSYLIKIISIFSKNFINGAFIITEKIIKIIFIKQDFNSISSNEIVGILIAILKSKYLDPKTFDFLSKLMIENLTINYIKIRSLKTLVERFINIKYENEYFFQEIYLKAKEKLKELETFNGNYDNEMFKNFIKEECMKERVLPETIIQKDYIKYVNMLNTVCVNCLFRSNIDYKFINVNEVVFQDELRFSFC